MIDNNKTHYMYIEDNIFNEITCTCDRTILNASMMSLLIQCTIEYETLIYALLSSNSDTPQHNETNTLGFYDAP